MMWKKGFSLFLAMLVVLGGLLAMPAMPARAISFGGGQGTSFAEIDIISPSFYGDPTYLQGSTMTIKADFSFNLGKKDKRICGLTKVSQTNSDRLVSSTGFRQNRFVAVGKTTYIGNRIVAKLNTKGIKPGQYIFWLMVKLSDYSGVICQYHTVTITKDPAAVRVTLPEIQEVERVRVSKVKLSASKKTITEGHYTTLKAAVSPSRAQNKAVTWKSSNKKVAWVDAQGHVIAIGTGKATITATTEDGKKKATCRVTVKKATSFADQVVTLTNLERTKRGRVPLMRDSALTKAAKLRANELTQFYSHTRPNGTSALTVFPSSFYARGENIAFGYPTPEAVVQGWMNSPGHRANILQPEFRRMAAGASNHYGRWYWVQLFGTRSSDDNARW